MYALRMQTVLYQLEM